MDGETFDPVTLEILWQRLITVADQMATTLGRTAFSNTIAAANDFGCVLTDAEGRCMVHANRSLPIFNRTLPRTVQSVLQAYPPSSIQSGDVFVANDPWLNAGHQPDISVITPIFREERLVGFAANIAHHADVGGTLNSNNAREVFEEGIIIPLVKLYDGGKLDELVVQFVTANVRTPRLFEGDIHAQVAANQAGAEKAIALLIEYELSDFQVLAAEIQDRSEAAMRAAIQTLPEGTYRSTVVIDELDQPLEIHCGVTVVGEELYVDFTGTSKQQPRGGINVTTSFTVGQASYALKCLLLPEVPGNDGCYRPLTISAPKGSILNAQRPASVRQRHRVGAHIFGTILATLAEVLPDRVLAGSGLLVSTNVFSRSKNNAIPAQSYCFSAGGMGASARADGLSTTQCPALAAVVPVELFEVAVPILVNQRCLLADSGGAGRFRGGLAQRVEYRLLPDFDGQATISIWAAGQNVPPFGLHGGQSGRPAEILLDGRVLNREEKLTATGAFLLTDSDTIIGYDTAAGGGYGYPDDRDPEAVKADVRDGLISRAAATNQYGVIFCKDSIDIDSAQTKRRRQQLRMRR